MQQNNITSVRTMFEQLPTEQLDEMLDKELHGESVDENAVRMILSVLREREKDYPVEMTPGLEKAWEKYQRDSAKIWGKSSRPRRVRNWALRAASAAAILVLLLSVIPQQAEAETFWEKLARWTAEIVEFFGPQDNDHRIVDYEFKTDNPGLQQVYDAAVEMGVTVPVVPMWLPEGSELVECTVDSMPAATRLYTRFICNNNSIIFSIDIYEVDVSHKYQKDKSATDYYEYGGVDYYILRNYDKMAAVWSMEDIECSLSIDCQEDILHRILKSIYTMEDNE